MPPVKKAAAKKTAVKKAAPRKAVSLVNPHWDTACLDWEELILAKKSLIKFKPLFPSACNDAMAVFDDLNIVDAGVTYGDCLPWVRDFAGAVFGSYCDVPGHESEGRRLIKSYFMLIPKKNIKSTLGAGIMLTLIVRNWRPEAEFILLAPTKEVADNSFKPIKAAIEADPELSSIFQVQQHIRSITHRVTNATLKVVAADSATVSGKKATVVLVDELHEFGKMAKAEDMLVEATGGLMSRPEGCVIYLTTQSSEPPAGVFKKQLDYARKVRDGKIVDPTYLPVIYEFPQFIVDQKLYFDEKYWGVVNPNLGVSVDIPTLRQKVLQARSSGEDSIQSILSKHFNIQIGLDLGSDRWPGADYWLENESKVVRSVEELIEKCDVLAIGIDGGGLDDLLALTVVGRITGSIDEYLSWSKAWVLELALTLRVEIADRLRDFANAGELTITKIPGEDVAELVVLVKKIHASELCIGIGIDPARISTILTALAAADIPTDEKYLVKVSQGWRLFSAILFTERALAEGRLRHAVQTLMNWCVGNCKVVARSNALLVTKEASGKAKIDPVMALFNAMELMSHNPEPKRDTWDFDKMQILG